MEENKIDKEYSPQVKAYTDKIEMLTGIVSKLEDTKRELDVIVANHQANTIEYQEKQVLLSEIVKDIEIKEGIKTKTTEEMNKLNNDKFNLNKEVEELNLVVEEKKKYVSDIETLKNQIATLQKEMETFQNEHSDNKVKAVNEINEIKLQVKKIHEHIGLLL